MDDDSPTLPEKKGFAKLTRKKYQKLRGRDSHVLSNQDDHEVLVPESSAASDDISVSTEVQTIDTKGREDDIVGNCWTSLPDEPFGLGFYLTSRGQCTLHVYLWLAKDLTWVQGWYYEGLVIGGLAVSLNIYCMAKSAYKRDIGDLWSYITEFFWLFANYWWMIGELHDSQFPDDVEIYDQHAHVSERIMTTALVWASLYYIILKPCGWNTALPSESSAKTGLVRFPSYFKSWDEYENTHTLLWSGKDTAWVWSNKRMWLVFFFPTAFVSMDFVWLTLYRKDMLIEHAHYVAQLLWMMANAVWAGGEFFFSPNHDEPLNMNRWSSEARVTARWYSSWVVVLAFVPLVVLYCIWIPATLLGKIPPKNHKGSRKESAPSAVEMVSSMMEIGHSNAAVSLVHIQSKQDGADGGGGLGQFSAVVGDEDCLSDNFRV